MLIHTGGSLCVQPYPSNPVHPYTFKCYKTYQQNTAEFLVVVLNWLRLNNNPSRISPRIVVRSRLKLQSVFIKDQSKDKQPNSFYSYTKDEGFYDLSNHIRNYLVIASADTNPKNETATLTGQNVTITSILSYRFL